MKIYGTLGILWLIVGCIGADVAADGLISLMMVSNHLDTKWHAYLHYCVSLLLLSSVIIVASMFLVRGADWARWLIGALAVVLIIIALIRHEFSFSIMRIMSGVFWFTSAILLLKPRQHDAT